MENKKGKKNFSNLGQALKAAGFAKKSKPKVDTDEVNHHLSEALTKLFFKPKK